MAYGKPVINTRLPGGVPYVSPNGVSGLTVPPNDASALAQAMQKLIDDDNLRKELGHNAYDRARNEFSMEKMLTLVLAEYKRLAGN